MYLCCGWARRARAEACFLVLFLCLCLFFYAGGWQLAIAQGGTEMEEQRRRGGFAARCDAEPREQGSAHYKSLLFLSRLVQIGTMPGLSRRDVGARDFVKRQRSHGNGTTS